MSDFFSNADLVAPDGLIYTDGKTTFGNKIRIGEGRTEDEFYLISQEEYEKLMMTETEEF